jgi:hypothetical protein
MMVDQLINASMAWTTNKVAPQKKQCALEGGMWRVKRGAITDDAI